MDSITRKHFDTLLTGVLEGDVTPLEREEFYSLLREHPDALDIWLDHCQMEAWLSDPDLREAPEDGKVIALGEDAEAELLPSPAQAAELSAEDKPRRSIAGKVLWSAAAVVSLLAIADALVSLNEPDDPALAVVSPVQAEEVQEHPAPLAPDLKREPAPDPVAEFQREWKTLLASTGSDKHPPIQENAVPPSRSQRAVMFNRDIRPILSETCFHCHGPDEHGRRADLRLDVPSATVADADGWQPIVPGDPTKSEFWRRIVSDDPDELMPPPESHMELTAHQKDLLRRWIEQGAEYEGHWAFIPPARPKVPEVSNPGWVRNGIDRFILARLDEEGLKPSPEADRRTLARRLYLDLTGLPPGREEMRAFLEDESPDAWEKLVDRLLDSPHYGERMAVQWLDAARYADTNGFSIDGGRHMWLWRDWVIQSFNSNQPFDQFTVEQLAGDLLPDPTQDQLIATGFNRNHMITHEGGTIPEENLVNYAADRVKTASEVFLGLTMACAQCHDHKFDPISIRDYYRFFAYFNTLGDKGLDGNAGANAAPSMMAVSPLPHDPEPVHDRLRELQADLEKPRPEDRRSWEKDLRYELEHLGENLKLHPMRVLGAKTPDRDVESVTILAEEVVQLNGGVRRAFTISTELPSDGVTGLRLAFEPDETTGTLGYNAEEPYPGAFFIAGVTVSEGRLPSDEIDLYSVVPLKTATASFSPPEHPATSVLDERYEFFWTPYPQIDRPQHLTLQFDRQISRDESPYVTVMVNFFSKYGRENNARRFRLFALTGQDDGSNIPAPLRDLLRVAEEKRTPEQQAEVERHYQEMAPGLQLLRDEIASCERRLKEMKEPHPVMVMDTAPKPRETFILERGDYASPADKVVAGTPEVLPALTDPENSDRLDLAKWLTHENHPLMARVTVNRFWQMIFGTGIVATSADFGSQGEWPSHPELLDWLAVEFRESGWDTKALMRLMVTSASYRQNSNVSPELRELDPGNRLLARGPRYRLQAEFVRDMALKTSGLLNDWVGGSSVNPGQPLNLWKEVSHYGSTPATAQVHVADRGLERHRRSLYTYWKRTVPPPNMAAFDAPNRETCVMQRSVTNTPLQALVMLNDPHFVEAAHAFAQRLVREHPEATAAERVGIAFEEALGRPAKEAEMKELIGLFEEQNDFTAVTQLILNLSEAITRG